MCACSAIERNLGNECGHSESAPVTSVGLLCIPSRFVGKMGNGSFTLKMINNDHRKSDKTSFDCWRENRNGQLDAAHSRYQMDFQWVTIVVVLYLPIA